MAHKQLEKPKLLAFKPMLYDTVNHNLMPTTAPEFVWPSDRIVSVSCPRNHKPPAQSCNCGVYLTMDMKEVRKYVHAPLTPENPILPIMAVFQVLGKTVVEGHNLRTWGVFLWGLVKPHELAVNAYFGTVIKPLWDKFHPVAYVHLKQAHKDAKETWKAYGLLKAVRS